MCLIPGLASGKYLESDELLDESLALSIPEGHGCTCGEPVSDGRKMSRREFGRSAGAATAALVAGGILGSGLEAAMAASPPAASASGEPEADRMIALGVSGGPVLSAVHSQPALCLVVNGNKYLVDCGGDTARQMVNAGLNFKRVRNVFITHQHLDHTAGYPELALLGWCYQQFGALQRNVRLWGPPPIEQMNHHLKQMFKVGTGLFETIGFPEYDPVIRAHNLALPRNGIVKVMEDRNVIVHATRVHHGPEVKNAYAYRFDIKSSGKSVAFSGDTVPDDNLVRLARGVDLLVHEAQMNSNIPAVIKGFAPSVRGPLKKHLYNSHTNVRAVPRIAKEAGAKRVSMCHYVLAKPEDFLAVAKSAAGRVGYTGEILAPVELDQIVL